jgi:DivIVA domain-containing protein
MDASATAQATIARIKAAKFLITRWDGYDEAEVDGFLDEVVARLDRGEPAGRGEAPVFSRTRLRPGYRKADVDALLKSLGV